MPSSTVQPGHGIVNASPSFLGGIGAARRTSYRVQNLGPAPMWVGNNDVTPDAGYRVGIGEVYETADPSSFYGCVRQRWQPTQTAFMLEGVPS